MSQIFESKLNELGITLTDTQKKQFIKFYELLVDWNKVMNLTGITEYEEVNEKHFVDSISIVKAIDINKVETVIDIGTGAGFPGIPLKIAFPHLKIVLLDSLNKRINFLNTVINELELKDIITIHGRAEDFAKKPEYREQFDLCVSRAVANLATLSEYCIPFVKIGGYFAPYKTAAAEEEIAEGKKALFILGGHLESVSEFSDAELDHTILWIKKVKMTPVKYPRKAGTPSKEPLK